MIRRLLVSAAAMFILTSVTFILLHKMPGGPFSGAQIPPDMQRIMEQAYGLDRSLPEQFLCYISGILRGNFGVSYTKNGVSVMAVIGRSAPVTLALGGAGVVCTVVLGCVLGCMDAWFSDRFRPCFLFIYGALSSIPGFALAMALLLVFCLRLRIFPASGLYTPAHFVLPVLALALYPSTVCAGLLAASIRKEAEKDYVFFLRTQGMDERKIFFFHMLRNAWTPLLGYLNQTVAYLLTGSFAVESVFNLPGLGREFVSSISNRDYTLVMGLVLYTAVIVIVTGLVTDCLAAVCDPQIRHAMSRKTP